MTELEVKMMQLRNMVYGSLNQPMMRNLANTIMFGLSNPIDKIKAIYNWTKKRIRYVPERYGRDVALLPTTTVSLGSGDCEDSAMLVASLAKLAGIPTRFKVISKNGSLYTHVYPQVLVNGNWISMDTTIPLPMGKEPSYQKAKTYVL